MSPNWYHSISTVLNQVTKLSPKSILDVSDQLGIYGALFREALEGRYGRYKKDDWNITIDGVEAIHQHIETSNDSSYHHVFPGTILTVLNQLDVYDIIYLGDVLSYFSKEEGKQLISVLLYHVNKALIVTTPAYLYKCTEAEKEKGFITKEKSIWSLVDFQDFRCRYLHIPAQGSSEHLFVLRPEIKSNEIFCQDSRIVKSPIKKHPLTIGYIIYHKNLTGGMKMLLQQMDELHKQGHRVYAFFISDCAKIEDVIPSWYQMRIDQCILIPSKMPVEPYLKGCDVIMLSWISQLLDLKDCNLPIVYWEQGHEYLFGDIPEQVDNEHIESYMQKCYSTKHTLLSVSTYVSKVIKARYGRQTPVLPNGIDTSFYYPGEKSQTNEILLVGNPYLPFKGFDIALKALRIVSLTGIKFHIIWVCQAPPKLEKTNFQVEVIVSPSQEKLAQYYRQADLFLSPSWYEGFGMPPLEAMASGTPVICTKCGGTQEYVQHGKNALMVEPGDIYAMAIHLIQLLKYPELRRTLSENGRKTAVEFDYTIIIKKLEDYLYGVCQGVEENI